jgi:hypothetical protein
MQTIRLQTAKLPKMLGDLMHSNQFLKMFSLASLGTSILTLTALLILINRPPLVLTFSSTGEVLERTNEVKAEDQIRAAITVYLERRYNWEPANVRQKLATASAFVASQSFKAYQGAVANVAKFSTDRLVSQRVFPDKMTVDIDKKTVLVTGDRVTAIQGLKAAGNLRLELSFESGPRTKANPWGVYISKEKEE